MGGTKADRVVMEKLGAAAMRPDGGPRAIRRIEFELIDAAQGTVSVSLWELRDDGLRLVYRGDTKAHELSGLLALAKTLFVAQQQEAGDHA